MTSPTHQITDPSKDSAGQAWKILACVQCSSDNAAEVRRLLLTLPLPPRCALNVSWWGRV